MNQMFIIINYFLFNRIVTLIICKIQVVVEKSTVDDLPPGWIKETRIRKNAFGKRRDPVWSFFLNSCLTYSAPLLMYLICCVWLMCWFLLVCVYFDQCFLAAVLHRSSQWICVPLQKGCIPLSRNWRDQQTCI